MSRQGLMLFALTLLVSAGCSTARRYEPAIDPDSLDGTRFLHYLGTVPVASFEEGCRAMLLAADGEDHFATHEERYAELVRRGWFAKPGRWGRMMCSIRARWRTWPLRPVECRAG